MIEWKQMRVSLIGTYEMGRQPFGLASAAAWLRRAGATVACQDLSREKLNDDTARAADLVAFYVPMHTATRLAARAAARVRQLNQRAHLCFYGLYAPLNAGYLRRLEGETILGGEFEQGLVDLVKHLEARGNLAAVPSPLVSLGRQQFLVPERDGLPPLASYAKLYLAGGESRVAGYTEASRGCKHLCRHCPVVPVYNGTFRVVQRDVVLEDIRRQVAAGAAHITFGDPDFFNGVRHGLEIVRALHREFPQLTYDVTIKVEHLLGHAEVLPELVSTGCLFVTTAVESVNDEILGRLNKGHTRADFYRVVELCRQAGLTLSPTFVAFTPWTTLADYRDLLSVLVDLDLVEHVAPIQLAIRLLIPAGSRLLDLEEVRRMVDGRFDEEELTFRWEHPDPRMDRLSREVQKIVWRGEGKGESRRTIFRRISEQAGMTARPLDDVPPYQRASVPYLNEPWYC